jgi:hypothetical protein
MERTISLAEAAQLFGGNFIGPEQSAHFASAMGIEYTDKHVPDIPFDADTLKKYAEEDALLILTYPSAINGEVVNLPYLRERWGMDSSEGPCFYNQDWYINESFYKDSHLSFSWNIIHTKVLEDSRGVRPEAADMESKFPSALLCAYVFFAYYCHCGQFLWEYDYVWCNDHDDTGDRIYVGRYRDILGLSRNGFSIHRHLSIKKNYGFCYVAKSI